MPLEDAAIIVDPVKDIPAEAVPLADYVAELNPDGVTHKVVEGNTFKIPDGADRFVLTAYRSSFPDVPELAIKCRAELSLDGGQTWQLLAAFTAAGKTTIDPVTSLPADRSEMSVQLIEPKNPNRLVRTTMVPIKDIRTKMECTFKEVTKATIAAAEAIK